MKIPQFDLQSLFPRGKDDRRPPRWFSRALIYVFCFVVFFFFLTDSFNKLSSILLVVILSLFFAMALEPVVLWLNSKGMNQRLAAFMCVFVIVGLLVASFIMFGGLFITQLNALIIGAPTFYLALREWFKISFAIDLPEVDEIGVKLLESWGKDLGTQALWAGFGLFNFLVSFLAIVLLVYYLCADGDKFRHTLIMWFDPEKQVWILKLLTVLQKKIGSFLGSRTILALLSTFFTSIFLFIIHVPYWLPLSVFMGVVSQFVPTVGTYLGGALPVVVALANGGAVQGMIVLIFLTVYQQIENFIFAPKVSAEALNMNPAVAFLCVLAFGSIWGAVGAFLALPLTATFVTLFKVLVRHYPVTEIN